MKAAARDAESTDARLRKNCDRSGSQALPKAPIVPPGALREAHGPVEAFSIGAPFVFPCGCCFYAGTMVGTVVPDRRLREWVRG